MAAPILGLILALFSAVAVARRRRLRIRLPARAVIVSPRRSTVINERGAVRSVQSAEVSIGAEDLERLWNATNLERLARTYWLFLSRVTLGLIRVVYGEHERSVVLVARPLTLLRFDAPEYVLEPDHGKVRWRIRDGLLVARSGRGSGFLSLDVRRAPPAADLTPTRPTSTPASTPAPVPPPAPAPTPDGHTTVRIEVEVANFYPAIAASIGTPVYEMTQSYVHVMVTHAFLRSLAKLDLAVSKVGRFERTRWPGSRPRLPQRLSRSGRP